MQEELAKINKVIEYIYFYGDKIETFTIDSVLRQSEQQNQPEYY